MAIRTKIMPVATGTLNKNVTDTATILAEIAAASPGDTIQLGSLDAGGQPASWLLGGVAVDNSTGKMLSTGGTPFLAQKLIWPNQLAITQIFIQKNLTFKGDTNLDGSPKTVITGYLYDHDFVDAPANVGCCWWIFNPLGKVVFQDLKFYETNSGPQILSPTDMINVVFDKCGQPVWISLDPRAVYPNFATATVGGDMVRNVPDWAWANPIKSLIKDCVFSNSYASWHMIGAVDLTIEDSVFGPFKTSEQDFNLSPAIGLFLNVITMERMSTPRPGVPPAFPAIITSQEHLTAWGRNVEIQNNTFTNEGATSGTMAAMLDITRNARGCSLENILVHDNDFVHMDLDPKGYYMSNWGGFFGNVLYLASAVNAAYPGYEMKNIRIFDNLFSGVDNAVAVFVQMQSFLTIPMDCWITDNKFEHFETSDLGMKLGAIHMEAADTVFLVKNEYIDSDLPDIDQAGGAVGNQYGLNFPIIPGYLNTCANVIIREKDNAFLDGDFTKNIVEEGGYNVKFFTNNSFKSSGRAGTSAASKQTTAAFRAKLELNPKNGILD